MAIVPGQPMDGQFNAYGIALSAPAASAVYAICGAQGTYLYFGESNNIQCRLTEHLNDPHDCDWACPASVDGYELGFQAVAGSCLLS